MAAPVPKIKTYTGVFKAYQPRPNGKGTGKGKGASKVRRARKSALNNEDGNLGPIRKNKQFLQSFKASSVPVEKDPIRELVQRARKDGEDMNHSTNIPVSVGSDRTGKRKDRRERRESFHNSRERVKAWVGGRTDGK